MKRLQYIFCSNMYIGPVYFRWQWVVGSPSTESRFAVSRVISNIMLNMSLNCVLCVTSMIIINIQRQ